MLTILNVAYPFAPVGLDSVGGAEQVLSQLDQALTLAGHRSIVVACEGSRVAGTLFATPAVQGPITPEVRRETYRLHRQTIERALEESVDLIHMHGIDFHEYLPAPGLPGLVTLHLPLKWYSPQLRTIQRPNTWMHCVSASQRRYGAPDVPLLDDIENGVAEFFFASRHAKKNFALALGRLCPEKGFHFALDACARAGLPCVLAGQAFGYPEHHGSHSLIGICLIRLEQIRPAGLPGVLGLSSENAAHRIAVEWTDDGGIPREGVFIPRRDTGSFLNRIAGGRVFPGEHHAARFAVTDSGGRIWFSMESLDGEVSVRVVGQDADSLPASSCFGSLAEASAFFEGGSLGYSVTRDCERLDGLLLRTMDWRIRSLAVTDVHSSFFANRDRFPEGSVEFDHALIMRDVLHEWHKAEDLYAVSRGG